MLIRYLQILQVYSNNCKQNLHDKTNLTNLIHKKTVGNTQILLKQLKKHFLATMFTQLH